MVNPVPIDTSPTVISASDCTLKFDVLPPVALDRVRRRYFDGVLVLHLVTGRLGYVPAAEPQVAVHVDPLLARNRCRCVAMRPGERERELTHDGRLPRSVAARRRTPDTS